MKYASDYYIYRYAVMFDLAVFPPAFKPVAARIKFKTQVAPGLPYDFVLVSGIAIAEPLTTADYGNIGYFTDPFGQVACAGPNTIHYLDLNAQGVAFISHYHIVRFGLRLSLDVDSNPPVAINMPVIYNAPSPDRPWLHLAYLTH